MPLQMLWVSSLRRRRSSGNKNPGTLSWHTACVVASLYQPVKGTTLSLRPVDSGWSSPASDPLWSQFYSAVDTRRGCARSCISVLSSHSMLNFGSIRHLVQQEGQTNHHPSHHHV